MSEMKKLTINGASFEIVDEQARLGVQEAKELATGATQVAESSLTSAKEYTDEKVAQLMNNSSEAVDSIMELATAMAENEGVVDALNQAIGGKANQSDLTAHINNFENPHNINKGTLGLDKVENKSSAEIIDEITKDDITGALGFTPVNAGEVNSAISSAIASKANISDLNSHVNDRNNPHNVTLSQLGVSIATDEEIMQMFAESNIFMAVMDSDGSILTDENGNILLW